MTREDRRQLVHAAMTTVAITLIWLPEWAYLSICGAVVVVEWVVLPLCGVDMGLERDCEPYFSGLRTYPVAVLAVLLVFGVVLGDLAAGVAAWGVLGIGDAASNLVGRRFGKPGFLGRADRSFVGTAAFVGTAWPAAWALATFVGARDARAAVLPALAAAVAGAVAELAPLPRWLDDNLPIALAAAVAFHFAAT